MEELNIESVKSFIESNKESDDIKAFLSGFEKEKELSVDNVKKFLNENKEGQSFYDKAKNEHLETWKANNFEKLFNEEAVKRGYELDDTTKKMRELEAKIEERDRKLAQAELRVLAKDKAKEKNLPFEIVDHFLGENEEATIKNIETFEAVWVEAVQKAVEKRIGEGARTPFKSDRNQPQALSVEEFRKLKYPERVKLKMENPELYNKLLKG